MPFTDNFIKQSYNGGGDPVIDLLRVSFDNEVFYFANNTQALESSVSGETNVFQRSSFKLTLPEDTDEGSPEATINFDAADMQIIRALRSADERINVTLWVVLASDPNTAEFGPVNYESTEFNVSGSSVSLKVQVEPILDVEIPSHRFTPNLFPGLWEAIG